MSIAKQIMGKKPEKVGLRLAQRLDQVANGADVVTHHRRNYRRPGPKNSLSQPGSWRRVKEGEDDFGPEDHQEPIDLSKIKVYPKLPPGAKRIHFYPVQHVLRPRGTPLSKESLSLLILDKLNDAFESWTDPKYGDAVSAEKLTSALRQILTLR